MRVAHIITRLILGGAQENTLFNCEDLIRSHGDEVLLVTGPALGPEGSLIDRARLNGVPLAILDSLRRAIHPARDLAAHRAIKRTLADFRPDVVHTHSAKAGMLGRAAAWSLNVPAVIHTVHGAPFHDYQPAAARWFFQRCERWAAARCHRLISVADAMTDLMVAAHVAPREKFTTIQSGMDVEPFLRSDETRSAARAELGYGDDDIVVGKIARLFHLKGHEYVIDAARLVAPLAPRVKFLFVGDGLSRGELERRVADAGLADRFLFTGLVPPERVPPLIAAMDIVVHASLREGLARVLPQALVSARPPISYDIDGAREVVIDGQTGVLLPPKSVAPLADAIVRLAHDAPLRARLGQEGRRRFTDIFRHERMTASIRALYQSALDDRSPR